MDKTKTRIILVLISVIILGGSYFGVLATEQKKRLATRNATQEEVVTSISEAERLRQEPLSRPNVLNSVSRWMMLRPSMRLF